MDTRATHRAHRLVRAGEGDTAGDPAFRADRFVLDGDATGGSVALVEHVLGPRSLAAPWHRHSREDEVSFVLEGEVVALLGDDVVVAGPGDVVLKPRGQWHTFGNPGDVTARVLEVIAPAGLEVLFRALGDPTGAYDEDALPALAARYGCDLDLERTVATATERGLRF